MDNPYVDFPVEADNTQFHTQPLQSIEKLHESFKELIDCQAIGELTVESFDFSVQNEWFDGCIRLFLSTDHLTIEFENHPTVFYLTGPAVLLDIDGEETDLYLEVGGQFDVAIKTHDAHPGILTIWHPQIDVEIGLLDAS